MESVDAGVKYKGLSLEGEFYWRKLGNYAGTNVGSLTGIDDHGFQYLNKCPVGYTAVPYPVGGNGNLFHANLEMHF